MIKTYPAYSEHLYLDKDNKNNIYVKDCQNLKQHQIDGLRFLYRQFKKKRLGAVLNFPPGCGKSLIVTLFLNAITSLLKERVLIVCTDDDEIEHWKELFLTWTGYKNDDIAIESPNPRVKKKIFLKIADDLTSYLRCNWSVIVIKDDICKSLQKIQLDADFKIWITSTDVKKDISLLSFIHKWMFPKSKINVNDILINEKAAKNKSLQSIILDSFLEDFVLRENKLKPISNTKNTKLLTEYKIGKTRKNKDITGTKIKRSKRTVGDECAASSNSTDIPTDNNNDNISAQKIKNNDSYNDIEIKKEITSHNDIPMHSLQAENHNCNNSLEIKEIPMKIEGSKSLDCRKAIDDIVTNENKTEPCIDESTESLDFEEYKSGVDQNSESILDTQNTYNFANTVQLENERNSRKIMLEDNLYTDNKSNIKMNCSQSTATEESKMGRNDLEHKMSELEKITMKKFKGSLLDSIF